MAPRVTYFKLEKISKQFPKEKNKVKVIFKSSRNYYLKNFNFIMYPKAFENSLLTLI